jgi:hypothetical protein
MITKPLISFSVGVFNELTTATSSRFTVILFGSTISEKKT